MSKFKVGDKVVRTSRTRDEVVVGNIYYVSEIIDSDNMYLVGCSKSYCSDYFELVEQKEQEMTFKNMKFDVAAIAKQLNVEHEEASRIIQEALFEQGYVWNNGTNTVIDTDYKQIQAWNDGNFTRSNADYENSDFVFYTIKPTYTIVEAEEQQEIVELNGKKYNKQELEKALSLLKPIE